MEKTIKKLEAKKEVAIVTHKESHKSVDSYTNKFLQLEPHQLIAKTLVNPYTIRRRILVEYGTGTGKTLTAIKISQEFINLYKKQYHNKTSVTPYCIILGFTRDIITREFLKFPELGYITEQEKYVLEQLKEKAKSNRPVDIELYQKEYNKIKKRLIDRDLGGFYKFYGYRELVNKLFDYEGESNQIPDLIKSGEIQPNKRFLEQFHNSLIICDEIHNVYNSAEKNNYGFAIQYILDYHKNNIFSVFMSATPINNSPAEIIDLLNLLKDPEDKHLKRSDFFTNSGKIIQDKLNLIGKLSFGKVLFLPALGEQYPSKKFIGVDIPNVEYLKFTTCKFSKLHQKTIKPFIEKNTVAIEDSIINDIVFPNPDTSSDVGIFQSTTLKAKIRNAPDKWKKSVGLDVDDSGIITGSFFKITNLAKYSDKYYQMVNQIMDIIKSKTNGKILLYHHWVKNGTMIIKQILLQNGFIEQGTPPANDTICANCGKTKKDKHTNHEYTPAHIAIIHNELDKKTISYTIEKFDASTNKYGGELKIIIGSKIIKEGFDFNCIQHLLVMSLPVNISNTLQLHGRAIRNKSHNMLPPYLRNVNIYTYVYLDSPELNKYQRKMADYLEIQKIMKEFHKYALTNITHYDFIKKYITNDNIYFLKYKPAFNLSKPTHLTTDTYVAYDYYVQEIQEIIMMIKRLYHSQFVWTYDDLWSAIKHFPYKTSYDTAKFDEKNFIIALSHLSEDITIFQNIFNEISAITDPDIRRIIIRGIDYVIRQVDKYYILCRLESGEPVINIGTYYESSCEQKQISITIPTNYNVKRKMQLLIEHLVKSYDLNKYRYRFFKDFIPEFHFYLLELIITKNTKSIPNKIVKQLIDIYSSFNILIGQRGYVGVDSNKIYKNGIWVDAPRDEYDPDENKVVVGYFKNNNLILRKPDYRSNFVKDARKIEKGIACTSKTKEDVIKLFKKLNLKYEKGLNINTMCDLILDELMILEEKQRSLKYPKLRYMYLFNEKT